MSLSMGYGGDLRRWGPALVLVVGVLTVIGLSGVQAVHQQGLVELDGDVTDATSEDPPFDWEQLFGADGSEIDVGDPLVVSGFNQDFERPDQTYHAGSDKDIEDIDTWQCEEKSNPQDKTDILNAYSAAFVDTSGELFLYFGFERATNNGNSFMGFWFLQNPASCTPPSLGGDGNFTGQHQEGDLLVLSDFTGGGSVSSVQVFRWNTSATNNLELLFEGADCGATASGDLSCGSVNNDPLVTPWPPANTTDDALGVNQFFEGGLAVDELLGTSQLPCFSTFIAETRSSQKQTAQLKDFVSETFETCGARISISPQTATNDVGTNHSYEILVERSVFNEPFEPVEGVEVNASIESGPGSFVGDGMCTTGADGTCNVTITSDTSGTTVVSAEADVPAGGQTIHVETDGTGENSGPATKVWERIPSDTTTTPTNASIVLGESLRDQVTVTGELGPASGNVSFFLCDPSTVEANGGTCSTGGTFIGNATLDDDGTATSPSVTPTEAGTWCFRAEYQGDDTYEPSQDASEGECFEVTPAEPGLSTLSDPTGSGIDPGTSVQDNATVEGLGGDFPEPTGTVTFFLCDPQNSTAGGCPVGSGDPIGDPVSVIDGQATSASTTPVPADLGPEDADLLGTYCWRAEYSGDANYQPANHTDGDAECLTYEGPISTLDKAVRVLPDGTFQDSVDADAGDSLEYRLVYENVGNANATEVILTEEVPEHSTFLSCSDACTEDGDGGPGTLLTWNLGTVEPGDPVDVTFQVQLDAVFPDGETTISNVATASTDEEPSDTPSDEVTVGVVADPELHLVKQADRSTAGPSQNVSYTLVFWNAGDADATQTVITETIPDGTSFVSCSDSCSVSGDTVTWNIGTVAAGTSAEEPAGNVTLTVHVDVQEDCEICNVASIDSPDEDDGPVSSNEVCFAVGADPTRADAAGHALGLGVSVPDLGLDEAFSEVNTSQSGIGGDDAAAVFLALGEDDTAGLASAEVLNASSASSVERDPPRASTTAISEVADVDLLGGLITADKVRGVATATATGDSASTSTAGSTFVDLEIDGVAMDEVAPNTRVDLPADLFGEGSHVALFEVDTNTTTPPEGTLVGGSYNATTNVTMIHVFLTDALPLVPGDQSAEIIVSQADAEANFPQTPVCEPEAGQAVSGHAFIASVTTDPSIAPVRAGFVSIEPTGGDEHQVLEDVDLGDGNVTADAAESRSQGELLASSSNASSRATVAEACLLPDDAGCLIAATGIESKVSAAADADEATAEGNTTIASLTVDGTAICSSETPCRPPPNTTIEVPGIGFVVLNEQVPDAPEDGRAGLTVRAIHVIVTVPDNPLGLAAGADVIVAESHADATFDPV